MLPYFHDTSILQVEQQQWTVSFVSLSRRLACLYTFRVCMRAVMSDIGTAPLQVVGYEGVFGCLAMFCVLLPLVQHTPGQDGSGLHEDSWETWHVQPLPSTPIFTHLLFLHLPVPTAVPPPDLS